MKKGVFLFILFIIYFVRPSVAQKGDNVFIIDSIHEIRLYFTQPNFWDTLVYQYEIKHGEVEEAVTPIIARMIFDGKTLDSIGVKLKSNFSYSIESKKKPIKLDFNSFVKGKKFDGLTALNLLNEFPDQSMLRNTVAFKIMRESGIKAPRTSFARVYLNDEYRGLYSIIEQVDKTFITSNFHRQGAELVKALSSPLFFEELDTMSYYATFEIKVNGQPPAWTRLIDLGRKIKQTPAEVFHDSLKNVFDLDGFVKVLAADIVFNNWDSYFYGQNYYLIFDSVDAKYYFIPWDYNLALNVYDISGGNFDLLPGGEDNHIFNLPLPSKVLANKMLRKKYLEEVGRINDLMLAQVSFIKKMHKKLRPALISDNGRIFTMIQYDNGLESKVEISEIPMVGLLKFIRDRNASVKKQLVNLKNN